MSWQQRFLQLLQVVSASALLPGGAVWIIYAIRYGFLPYLAGALSTQVFVLITVILGFVFAVGLGYGFVCSAWLQILVIRLAKTSHPLLPARSLGRFGASLLSALICSVFGALAWLSATGLADRDFFRLFGYFLVASFFTSMVFVGPNQTPVVFRKLVVFASVVPLALLLVAIPVIVPMLDITMEIIGFRSKPSDLVFLSQDAFEQLHAVAALYGKAPKTCMTMMRHREMLLVEGGTVVWKSALPQAFVGVSVATVPPVMVERDDVLALPRTGAMPCQLVR